MKKSTAISIVLAVYLIVNIRVVWLILRVMMSMP